MNYSARERFEQLMQSQGQSMAAPLQGTRSSQMLSAVRMARGGEVGGLPTLAEMSNPGFQFQGTQLGASAPFTQMNPIVPMFSLEAPAFGGMEQSTYDFTAPVVQGGSMYQPPRQAPVMTESTSAFRPVDATTVMDGSGNIPNVPVTPPPYVPPVGQTQPGVATTGSPIPTVITAEERAAREAAGIQAELERRQAAEQAAQQAAAQEEAQRLEQAEQERLASARAQAQAQRVAREQAAAQAEAQARAQAEAQAEAQARASAEQERAQAEAQARAQAEAQARAQAEAQARASAAQASAAAERQRRFDLLAGVGGSGFFGGGGHSVNPLQVGVSTGGNHN